MPRKIIKKISLIVIGLLILFVIFFVYQNYQENQPKPFSSWRIEVKLLDVSSGQVIPNTKAELYSSNGIVCIKAPCPNESRFWQDTSNDKGFFSFPGEFLEYNADLSVTGYYRTGLMKIERNAAGEWFIVLNKINN